MDILIPVCTLVLIGLALLWIFVPVFSGTPWIPTTDRRIRKALELAGLKKGEIFYDLGCGDGRVLIAAVERYGVRAVGIEISPLHCLVARVRAAAAGVGKQVSIRWGNIYTANFKEADAVFHYGRSNYAERLKQQLERQLQGGARVISIIVDLPGWQPEVFDSDNLIFLYRMPPPPGDLTSYLMQELKPVEEENKK